MAQAGTALVVGAGLAGSAVAHSLALRGWQVTVLGAGGTPADGASGLPAGLFCPHVSPDDSVLSRLSRSGVRMTLQRLRDVCQEGADWAPSGVLEHCTDGGTGLPASWATGPGAQWSHAPSAEQLHTAGLPADTVACWHAQAGWVVRPAQLVQPSCNTCASNSSAMPQVARLHTSADGRWEALDADGQVLAQADLAGAGLRPRDPWRCCLLAHRGSFKRCAVKSPGLAHAQQCSGTAAISRQRQRQPRAPCALPRWADVGHGLHLLAGCGQHADFAGRPNRRPQRELEQAGNPAARQRCAPLAPWFTPGDERCQPTWGRVRVASHDRLPIAARWAIPHPACGPAPPWAHAG